MALRLLVDTSTWLDLARRRDGQKWIVPVRLLIHHGDIELLVPDLILAEFERNRGRIENAMSSGVAERFRLLRRDILDYGGDGQEEALRWVDSLAHQVPLIGAMTTRNFAEILDLLRAGRRLEPGPDDYAAVVERGLRKIAPLHRQKNSVADALLVELYASALADRALSDHYAFVTTNHEDFSISGADRRQPHADIATLFGDGSTFHLGVEGLVSLLQEVFGDEFKELVEESDFYEEPRRLDEILEAEQEFFDRVWHERHLVFRMKYESGRDERTPQEIYRMALGAAERVRARRPDLEPVKDDFEWGMWNGKLSALRWVLGSEWDFLDT